MTDPAITPTRLVKEKSGEFSVEWKDGRAGTYKGKDLRLACPCANCRDEFTGERKIRPENILDSTTVSEAKLVGNYAVCFTFSDGHKTGVYSFEYLRELLA